MSHWFEDLWAEWDQDDPAVRRLTEGQPGHRPPEAPGTTERPVEAEPVHPAAATPLTLREQVIQYVNRLKAGDKSAVDPRSRR